MKRYKFKLILLSCILLPIIISCSYLYVKKVHFNKPIHIIYISKSNDMTNGFWRSIANGAELATSEYGIELSIWTPDEEENYASQNKLIYEAIHEKPDAIILAAAGRKETYEAAKEIVDNDIILVLVDSTVEGDIADAVVATNNYQAGIRIGAVMKTFLEDGDKIGIISSVEGTSTAIDREAGIRMGLTDDKERIVDTYFAESNTEKAEELTKEMLTKYPDIKAIATLNQHSSVGAGRALKELGLDGEVFLFGFDNAKEQITYLEDGTFQALLIQKPFNMGYISVETAIKLVKGQQVEKDVNTGSALITKDNMYSSLHQKLLFPFMEE
jgi:ribose transport system substrate-binding protein